MSKISSGVTNYSDLFFGLALGIRFIQGVGDSMVATSAYSIVSMEFPNQREVYIGYCQTAVGLGLLLGPVIGTTIYKFAHYEATFYILAGVLSCSLITAIFLLPARINRSVQVNEAVLEQRGADTRPSIQGPRPQGIAERYSVDMVGLAKVSERYSRRSHVMMAQVTYKIFFTNMRAMTAIVSSMFAMIFMLFYEPVFTKYVAIDRKWVDKDNVGTQIELKFISPFRLLPCHRLLHLRLRFSPCRRPLLKGPSPLCDMLSLHFLLNLPLPPRSLSHLELPTVRLKKTPNQ